jgi:hypothetical protein
LNDIRIEPNETGFLLTKTLEFQGDLLPKFRDAPITDEFKMTLSEGYRVRTWAQNLAAILSLLTDVPASPMLKTVNQVSDPIPKRSHFTISGMAHAESFAEPREVPLTTELLGNALELVQKLSSTPQMELFLRAIGWYARGVADTDLIYKFKHHWIALETLSNTYDGNGNIHPRKCTNCGKTLNKRPSGSVMRAFLLSLGVQEFTGDVVRCSVIRGRLFHGAGAAEEEAITMQPILSGALRRCIFESLKNVV